MSYLYRFSTLIIVILITSGCASFSEHDYKTEDPEKDAQEVVRRTANESLKDPNHEYKTYLIADYILNTGRLFETSPPLAIAAAVIGATLLLLPDKNEEFKSFYEECASLIGVEKNRCILENDTKFKRRFTDDSNKVDEKIMTIDYLGNAYSKLIATQSKKEYP